MKKTLKITKILGLNMLRQIGSYSRGKFIRIIIYMLPLLLIPNFVMVIKGLINALGSFGLEWFALPLIANLVSIFIVTSTISSIAGILVNSKSLELAIAMPVKTTQVMGASVILQYISGLGISAYVMLVTLLVYGIEISFAPAIPIILVTFLLPIIPIAISLLIITPLMRIFTKPVARTFVLGISGFLFAALYFLFIMSSAKSVGMMQNQMETLMSMFGYYPPTKLAGVFMTEGFSSEGLLNFALLLAISIAGIILIVLITKIMARKLYTISDSPSGGKIKKASSESAKTPRSGNASVGISTVPSRRSRNYWLFKRQLRYLFSTGNFIANYLMTAAMPVILAYSYHIFGLVDLSRLGSVGKMPMVVIIIMGAFVSPLIFNTSVVTNISRERKSYWENKLWPMSSKANVQNRFMFNLLSFLPFQLMIGILVIIYTKALPLYAFLGVLASAGYTVFNISFSMLVEYRKPYFDWELPRHLTKNSAQVLISTFSHLGIISVVAFFVFFFTISKILSFDTVVVLVSILAFLSGVITYLILMKKGVKLFDRIEL